MKQPGYLKITPYGGSGARCRVDGWTGRRSDSQGVRWAEANERRPFPVGFPSVDV